MASLQVIFRLAQLREEIGNSIIKYEV